MVLTEKTKMIKHYLELKDLSLEEYRYLFYHALLSKRTAPASYKPNNKMLALLFSKKSTRTRISFDVGMKHLGGSSMFINYNDTQMTRGESLEDTATIISSMIDCVVCRTEEHNFLEEFSRFSTVPVINGLSNEHHPCQVASDILTFIECRGSIEGKKVAWVGDSNNMLCSWIQAAKIFNFKLNIATFNRKSLPFYDLESCRYYSDPLESCRNAHLITTDTMVSMDCETNLPAQQWEWRVCDKMLNAARPEVIFLHCLPAHRAEEVSALSLEGPRSSVFLEAQNRLFFQKELLIYLMRFN